MKLSIPLENIEALQQRFAQLEAKAAKLRAPCPQLIMGEVYGVERKFSKSTGDLLVFPEMDFYQRIELSGEGVDKPISYGTHHIVGVYNHEYERVMYNSFSSDIKPRPEYNERFRLKNTSHCEHCNKTIHRNNTYLIASEDGEQMLVGSSCMKAFIPLGKSVESIVAYYKSVFDAYISDDLFEREYDGLRNFRSTQKFVAMVYLVRQHTNVSPSDKEGMRCMLYNFESDFKACLTEYKITQDDIIAAREKAHEIIEWWKAEDISESNEFNYKLQTIALSQHMRIRDENLAQWLVHVWMRHIAAKAIIADSGNEFVGQVGERLNKIEAVVEREQFLYQNDYGTTYLYLFKTKEGNTIAWKTSPRDLKPGDRLAISARVKSHEEYNGIKQTFVTRPTFEEIES